MKDKPINIYLREITKFKLPTLEEEHKLIREIRAGNESAFEKLVIRHLQSVVKIVKLYRKSNISLEDLIDEGNIGLIRALKTYDLSKGVRFISYASWWIRHYINHAIYRQLCIVKVPIQKLASRKLVKEIESTLAQELGRLPSVIEIAEALGITPTEITQAIELVQNDLSLDAKISEDDTSLLDFLKESPEKLEDSIVRELLVGELEEHICELSDTEKVVIKLRFGLNGEPCHRLREIGEVLNLTRERVRQIEEKALEKLRKKAR